LAVTGIYTLFHHSTPKLAINTSLSLIRATQPNLKKY